MSLLKKLLRNLFMLSVIVLIMTGCKSSTMQYPVLVEPPAELMTPCPELPKLGGKKGKDILPWAHKVATEYNECKIKHKALGKAWPKPKI